MTAPMLYDAIEFPPSFDGSEIVKATRHNAWEMRGDGGREYRRGITWDSPLMFAITYLGHRLRQQDTGLMSFADLHLDMCRSAYRWIDPVVTRDIWVAPRRSAKSEYAFCLHPLWALAHGHREFFLGLSYTDPQASGLLADVRVELDTNELLMQDFPELRPKKARGASQTQTRVVASGATFAARGLNGTALGIKSMSKRPDLLAGDDLEPAAKDYTPAAKLKLQAKLTQSILPMLAPHGAVTLVGTVTMRGSMIHDAVRVAKGQTTPANAWVRARGFTPHHYSPITPGGQSMWPQSWTVAELEAERRADPLDYALNYECDPSDTEGVTWWTPDSFTFNERFPIGERVLHVDTATTANASSDYFVLALVARSNDGLRACVERVEWGQWAPDRARDMIHEICEPLGARLPLVRVEGNQGGDVWLSSLGPWPAGVRREIVHARGSKTGRIERAYNHYARGAVVHAWPMPALQDELVAWPEGPRDDVPDAIAGALDWVFKYREH